MLRKTKRILGKISNSIIYKSITLVLSILAILIGLGIVPSMNFPSINFSISDMVWGTATLCGKVDPKDLGYVDISFIYGNTSEGPYPFETPKVRIEEFTRYCHTLEGLRMGFRYYYRLKVEHLPTGDVWLDVEKSLIVVEEEQAFK